MRARPCACVHASALFCQVATPQVSLRACVAPFSLSFGSRGPKSLRRQRGDYANASRRGPVGDANVPLDSLLRLVVARRKLNQTMVVGAQRSCWWLFHYRRAVFWPDRTRSRPAKPTKKPSRRPRSTPERRTKRAHVRGFSRSGPRVTVSRTSPRSRSRSRTHRSDTRNTCEFAYQVPVDVS